EIHLLGSHRLRFDDQPRALLLRQREHEISDIGGVPAVYDFAAVRYYVALEFFEVVVQIIDGVFLKLVSVTAEFLVIGEDVRCDVLDSFLLQAARGGIDSKLEIGVSQGLVNFLIEFDAHGISGWPALRRDAKCECPTRRARERPGSA